MENGPAPASSAVAVTIRDETAVRAPFLAFKTIIKPGQFSMEILGQFSAEIDTRGLRPRLSDRRTSPRRPEKRPSGPRARGLVPALFRISPLLSEPPPADAGL